DCWGKQAALIHQAKALAASADLDRAAARLALSGSLAQAYVDLDLAYVIGDIATRTVAQRERLLHLARVRLTTGLDTAIEVNVAESRLAEARNSLLQAGSMRELAVHRLAALSGRGAELYS